MASKPQSEDRPTRRTSFSLFTYESEGEGSPLPLWLTIAGLLFGVLGLAATVAFGVGLFP